MAKKIKYFVIDANGEEHTRSSSRVYTHMVAVQRNRAAYEATIVNAETSKLDGKNYDYLSQVAAGTHPHVIFVKSEYHHSYTAEQIAKWEEQKRADILDTIESAKKEIGSMTREEYIQDQEDARRATVEATDFNEWLSVGWCGRLDLAQKLASNYATAQIIEANVR